MSPQESLPRPSLAASYAANRQRSEVWRRTRDLAERWSEEWKENLEDEATVAALGAALEELGRIERYWAYPGRRVVARMRSLVDSGDCEGLEDLVTLIVRMLVSEAYRVYSAENEEQAELDGDEAYAAHPDLILDERPYFEVLIVDELSLREQDQLRERLLAFRTDNDPFVYDVVVVSSFEDALIAVLLNHHLQSVVIRYTFPVASQYRLGMAERALAQVAAMGLDGSAIGQRLGEAIHRLRPNLDLFLVSDANVEDIAGTHHRLFDRIFFRQEDLREMHLCIVRGVQARELTPFFSALQRYSLRPTGVFHALPIARGKSITRSHWIRELEELFGSNLFMAETSATTAGLDSLLQPHGSLKEAQALAARAFGADRTWFVTNGTSTANKIVLQAVTQPGDIVLATRDCHMSHHYAFALCGVSPVYMDPYPLRPFGFYGGVSIATLKTHLLDLKARGELDRARVLLLTNCTFDGIVYNPLRVMEEVLAIQPKMIFIWDEAWFAFAAFTPITRHRTAMEGARMLRERIQSDGYRADYATWKAGFDADPSVDKWMGRLMADPDAARVRVYATQSTHKTLTSLRQGSMIHAQDQDFAATEEAFQQAYLTHTSSSANYPILASLDMGRRQVELEGYELVNHAIDLAMILRKRVIEDPQISRWFRILTPLDLVPEEFRPSGFSAYGSATEEEWEGMDEAWATDEFCLDPTRITLFTGASGLGGDDFKRLLIDRFDIQVNKTSLNTVLFMTHIGTTRSAVAHLIDVLSSISERLTLEAKSRGSHRLKAQTRTIADLSGPQAPLPNASGFHPRFRDSATEGPEGDIRTAFFAAISDDKVRYLHLDGSVLQAMAEGPVVSAAFVTPYPPGFPILVPGQIISEDILDFLKSVRVSEIHGYEPELGLRVFTDEALLK